MDINILGTNYKIYFKTEQEEPLLEGCDGFCDGSVKMIVARDIVNTPPEVDDLQDRQYAQDRVLRHEIIHAFLIESGLSTESDWAENEEMVDYFALQFYKIANVFKELNI